MKTRTARDGTIFFANLCRSLSTLAAKKNRRGATFSGRGPVARALQDDPGHWYLVKLRAHPHCAREGVRAPAAVADADRSESHWLAALLSPSGRRRHHQLDPPPLAFPRPPLRLPILSLAAGALHREGVLISGDTRPGPKGWLGSTWSGSSHALKRSATAAQVESSLSSAAACKTGSHCEAAEKLAGSSLAAQSPVATRASMMS